MNLKTLAIFIFSCCLLLETSGKEWVSTGPGKPSGPEIKLQEAGIHTQRITISLDGFKKKKVTTPGGEEFTIHLEGGVPIAEKGSPDLPRLVIPLVIPDLEKMEARIVNVQYQDFAGHSVAPSKGHFSRKINPQQVPYVYGGAYESKDFWPEDIAGLSDPYIMRDVRGQNLVISPIHYQPLTKTLRVYTQLEIEIKTVGKGGANQMERKKNLARTTREFTQIYQNFFFNWDAFTKNYPLAEEEGSLLIICYDDYLESMIPFVEWKRTTGRKTAMVPASEAGTTPGEIREFVSDYYQEHEDFAFLLLVGDAPDQIPVYAFEITGPNDMGYSDSWYAFLDGSDAYNDIIVGRFSASSIDHVETQVEKVIAYERDLGQEDHWLSTGLGIARNEGAGSGHYGESDFEHMDFIRDSLLNYTYDIVHREYDGDVPGLPNTTAAKISQRINEGAGIINYCNHGLSTGWSVADYDIGNVNDLTNTGKLPFIWSVACLNGNFSGQDCFAEAWMRATHQGAPAGAVGAFMSSISQDWVPPMTAQDEMVTILVEERDHLKRTFGGLSINGSMAMVAAYGNTGKINHKTWILFGDPSMKVRTKAPEPIAVTYDPEIIVGSTSFAVQSGHEGLLTALSTRDHNGEWIKLGAARVINGEAVIAFEEPLNEPGLLTLAVTGFNKQTYLNENLQVVPADGPYLHLESYEINDELGNQNGLADFGEALSFNLVVKNIGTQEAQDGYAILQSTDEYVEIAGSLIELGSLNADETLALEKKFLVHIDENIPDQHILQFRLLFECNESVTTSFFSFPVNAPDPELLSLMMDDSETGNDNGIFDPGEIVKLYFTIQNNGHASSGNLYAMADPATENLIFLDQDVPVGDVPPGSQATFSITAMAAPQQYQEVTEYFTLELQNEGFVFEKELEVVIGLLPEYHTHTDEIFIACQGWFLDSGGRDNNYGYNEDYKVTFFPEQSGSQLEFVFESFQLTDSYGCNQDFLKIYDGPNTNFPIMGTWCGDNSPGTLESDNDHGALTFHFQSSGSTTFPGWEARFGCTRMPLHFENLTAYPEEICMGEQTQLSAMVYGGLDTLSYNWSPGESLNDSTVSNPLAFPVQTTLYSLEVTDGTTSHSENILITVHPAPEVDLGEDLTICRDQVEVLDAGDHYSYLWNDGSAERFKEVYYPDYQTDQADIWVEVGNVHGCASRDSILVTFMDCVSVPHFPVQAPINCYPNPARDEITLEFSGEKPQWLKIFNLNGEKIWSVKAPAASFKLDVRGFDRGTYLLVFKTGKKVYTEKIVIMR